MATNCIAQLTFRYQGLPSPIVARFDVPHASSDGGLVLLKAVDERLRLTETVAACLMDGRQAGKVAHPVLDLVRQRVFGLVAGYLDGNDAARLADDPLHKLVLDREPLTGPALGSQPTLSRFENAVARRDLVCLGHRVARTVIAHHRRRLHGRAHRITIDLDPTDDPTHGQQELSFFNGHYETACYLPLVATLTFDDEPMQYLVGIVLRPGNAAAGRGAIGRLRWLLGELGRAFPCAALRVRLDGGFAGPRLLTFLDRAGVEYVVGLPGNARVDKRIRRLRGRARVLFRTTGQPTALFGETRYAAKSWGRKRRVIMKAEVVKYPGRAPRDNPRFVVTNLTLEPEAVYGIYRQRGDVENRYKELKDSLGLGRTSCPRFLANQFRVLLTAIAYVLFQTLQQYAQGTASAGAQVSTLRERLIKLAVYITRSARRIVLHLPQSCPWLATWRQLARAVGARAG
jgi:Transposase DDE domain group 1